MTELDIVGLGTWSPRFANWQAFAKGMQSGDWAADVALQPDLIPPRERRRAPQLVKMAVEVMSQACNMAELEPNDVATVFSSAMGDMQITDYMCQALAMTPKLISPTRFHNSVHNAAPGYWSIATGAFSPANAISAFQYTSSMAFLEGAVQAAEENTPVLVVTQEVAAPFTLVDICPSEQPFSAAFLVAPPGLANDPVCSIRFSVSTKTSQWPPMPADLKDSFISNISARLLPLLAELAALPGRKEQHSLVFPLSSFSSLLLTLTPTGNDRE